MSRNRMGLLSGSRPIFSVELPLPMRELGELVKEALAGSAAARGKNPTFVDRTGELMSAAGLKTWDEWRPLPMCNVEDNDSGNLRFVPMRPDGIGHEGIRRGILTIPLASSAEEIGSALWTCAERARGHPKR